MPFGLSKATVLGAAGSGGGSPDEGGKYEWIAGYTGGSSSYNFTSLPAGYNEYEVRIFAPAQSSELSVSWQVNSLNTGYWYNSWVSYNSNKWSTSSSNNSDNRLVWQSGTNSVSGTVSFVNVNKNDKVAGMSLGGNNYISGNNYGVLKQTSALTGAVQSSGITAITIYSSFGNTFDSNSTINLFGIKDS